ncbi:MAG: putative selenium-dependent hydroxylase accessory protein YqeC [Deltaproteobacteria bacterium]|nr:MAG: putative selenium-dependent hydroxylase accessory protein YqeC [Deltaproteobacteria bacterium]
MRGEHAMPIKAVTTLREALGIHPKEVISLVGAGGKTTLMFALTRELAQKGKTVITSTTTKIFPPSPSETACFFVSNDEDEIIDFLLKNAGEKGCITIGSELLADSQKLRGVRPFLVSRVIGLNPVEYVIIEADGAAQRPLKAPNPEYEPVIPSSTTLVIPVVGIDALGSQLSEERVFRSEIASRLTGVPLGEVVTAETIARLILHPSGLATGSPAEARIIPFINKMDLSPDRSAARNLAHEILNSKRPRIDRVVLGQAQVHPPVVEVIYRE